MYNVGGVDVSVCINKLALTPGGILLTLGTMAERRFTLHSEPDHSFSFIFYLSTGIRNNVICCINKNNSIKSIRLTAM